MVETTTDLGKLAPRERLKHLKDLEEEKRRTLDDEIVRRRKELEDELARKKKALEELEKKTKNELEETEELEQQAVRDALEEVEHRQEEVKALEARVKEFSDGSEFVPAQPEPQRQAPPITGLYQQGFAHAEEGIDYLLHATPTSEERLVERERSLYQNVRWMAEELKQGHIEEGYMFNRLQDQVNALRQRTGDEHGYLSRIANVLNGIVDYHSEDEERRKRQG